MKIPSKCKVCEKAFVAIKHTQLFCSRKCFKKDYAARKRAEALVENARVKQHFYACGVCERRSELGFNPLKSQQQFADYICPFCGIPRQIVWTHRYDATFNIGSGTVNYVVNSAIVSFIEPRTTNQF